MESLKPKINIRDSETLLCDKCGHMYFTEVIYLKKVSKFLIPNATDDQVVPFPIYKCDSCGNINKGFNPFEEEPTEDSPKINLND